MKQPPPKIRRSQRWAFLALWVAVWALTGCPGASPAVPKLRIFAAASLSDVFQALEKRFNETQTSMEVEFSFAGSQVLRLQIEQGAPADVFASANRAHVQTLRDSQLLDEATPFASNELVIITPRDNPARITSLEDLPGVKRLILGNPNVPVGDYARQVLHKAAKFLGPDFPSKVMARAASLENNSRLVRAKIEMGEAEAALVYLTDAYASERVRRIAIPPGYNARARYFMGPLRRSPHRQSIRRWMNFVKSPEGQAILQKHGFGGA